MNRLTQHGWEVVRRATGGRAILHTDELTYSVIAPVNEPRAEGSVLESYNRLAQALLLGPSRWSEGFLSAPREAARRERP